jgi:hypothetical protein
MGSQLVAQLLLYRGSARPEGLALPRGIEGGVVVYNYTWPLPYRFNCYWSAPLPPCCKGHGQEGEDVHTAPVGHQDAACEAIASVEVKVVDDGIGVNNTPTSTHVHRNSSFRSVCLGAEYGLSTCWH